MLGYHTHISYVAATTSTSTWGAKWIRFIMGDHKAEGWKYSNNGYYLWNFLIGLLVSVYQLTNW